MAGIKTFKEILAWQKGHELTLAIYKLAASFPKYEEFGLANQMRRSSASIPSNIAEGFKRKSSKDSVHFYNISEGSLEELKYQILLAKDLGYLNEQKYSTLDSLAEETGRILFGWIKIQK